MLPGNYGYSHANFNPISGKILAILPTGINVASTLLDQTFNVGAAYLSYVGRHIPPFSVFMGYRVPWNSPSLSGNVTAQGFPHGSKPSGPEGLRTGSINQCVWSPNSNVKVGKKRYKRKVRKTKFNKKLKRKRFTI